MNHPILDCSMLFALLVKSLKMIFVFAIFLHALTGNRHLISDQIDELPKIIVLRQQCDDIDDMDRNF
jgi:succinate dehydrogenase hydrophobic anchor subunit